MKKYRNIIIIGIVFLALGIFLISRYVVIADVFLSFGIYDEKITVLNTADVHGHILYDEEIGYYSLTKAQVIKGLPLLKHLVDKNREKNEHTLLLDSGDLFHGTNEANINDGEAVVNIANQMGYQAMVPGNHDFNFGMDRLLEIESELNFPILSANILKDGTPVFQEHKILTLGDIHIGLFGLTVEDALHYTNAKDFEGYSIESAVNAANRVLPKLRKNCDVVILISHLGDDIDRELVQQVNGIDLILCGHHHYLYAKPDMINNTALVEAGSYATHLGVADLYFKENALKKITWRTETITDQSKADPGMDNIAQQYHAIALEEGKEVVGKANVRLNGLRSKVRSEETNLANLLTDAMREIGNADIALMNGGGIRQSLDAGEVNLYDLGKILPFYNSLVTVEIQGEMIYKAIERGLRQYPNGTSNGGFLQVSGIRYEFDGSKMAGERLVGVYMDGTPLDREKTFLVATNDYLYHGGDEYDEFKSGRLVSQGALLKDVLAEYLRQKQNVEPEMEGRIQVLNQRYQ